METLVTAQLSTHQSAGDVIGCVNGAGVMCCVRSMAQQSLSQTSPAPLSSRSPPPQSCLHPVSYHADDLNDAKLSGVKRLVVFFFKSIVQFEDTFTDLTMWEIP